MSDEPAEVPGGSVWRRLRGSATVAAHLRGQLAAPFLPRAEIDARRDRRIRELVAFAARHVPHYRDAFAELGVDPRSVRGAAELDRLPALDREAVRARPERFLADTPAGREAVSFLTSGSTGVPTRISHDRRYLLANLPIGERERAPVNEICGGFRPKEIYVGYATSTFKKVTAFYDANLFLPLRPRRRFVSLATPVEEVVRLLERERPDALVGYGGWFDRFFRTALARGLDFPPPKLVMYMGEGLPPGGRELIEGRFGIPLLSRYNAVESFKIGFYCAARTGFHLHEDLCHVRIVRPDGTTCAEGEPGRVLLTNLTGRGTVLLNYPIGDVAALSGQPCPCGRTFRRLTELEGRVEDVVTLPDGRFVHPRAIWQVVKDDAEILQYRLTQHEPRRFELQLATLDAPAFDRALARALAGLRPILGAEAEIEASRLPELEASSGGKHRAVTVRCRPVAV